MGEYDLLAGVSVHYFSVVVVFKSLARILHIQSGDINSTCRMTNWHEAIDCH